MSAPAYARRGAAPEGDRQPRLFALPGGAAAGETLADAPERTPVALAAAPAATPTPFATPGAAPAAAPLQRAALAPVPDSRSRRTLDGELRLAWAALTAGAPIACLMCGGRMEPRAHAPGGACTSCGTTLD